MRSPFPTLIVSENSLIRSKGLTLNHSFAMIKFPHHTDHSQVVHPDRFSTPMPSNCDDFDLEEQPSDHPTISSYTIALIKSKSLHMC